jgi:hypothetical protein
MSGMDYEDLGSGMALEVLDAAPDVTAVFGFNDLEFSPAAVTVHG